MNKNILLIFGLFVSLIFLSNKGGRNQPTTGAPFENSGPACAACHSGGSFVPKIEVVLKDAADKVVSSYMTGKEYTIEMKISATGNPSSYGFQAVVTDKSANQAGEITTLGDKVRKLTLLNKTYLTHISPRVDGVFTTKWKAPASDTVLVYIAGLATNNNGGTGGDKSIFTSIKLNNALASGTIDFTKRKSLLASNVVSNEIIFNQNIDLINLLDINGKTIYQNSTNKNIANLISGIYILQYMNEGVLVSEKILKQ